MDSNRHTLKVWAGWLLRFGLGLIFLTKGLVAWFNPSEFRDLLSTSFLHTLIGQTDWFTFVIAVNDTLLFLLILSGRWHTVVTAWASL